jgi:hypothetical protein
MLIFLASLAAILALTGLAFALGFRARPMLDEAGARGEAEGRLAGFRAAEVVLAADGHGAVLKGRDGSVALLLPLGDGWIARRTLPSSLSCADGRLTARLREPMLPEARLLLARCPDWLPDVQGARA